MLCTTTPAAKAVLNAGLIARLKACSTRSAILAYCTDRRPLSYARDDSIGFETSARDDGVGTTTKWPAITRAEMI